MPSNIHMVMSMTLRAAVTRSQRERGHWDLREEGLGSSTDPVEETKTRSAVTKMQRIATHNYDCY